MSISSSLTAYWSEAKRWLNWASEGVEKRKVISDPPFVAGSLAVENDAFGNGWSPWSVVWGLKIGCCSRNVLAKSPGVRPNSAATPEILSPAATVYDFPPVVKTVPWTKTSGTSWLATARSAAVIPNSLAMDSKVSSASGLSRTAVRLTAAPGLKRPMGPGSWTTCNPAAKAASPVASTPNCCARLASVSPGAIGTVCPLYVTWAPTLRSCGMSAMASTSVSSLTA